MGNYDPRITAKLVDISGPVDPGIIEKAIERDTLVNSWLLCIGLLMIAAGIVFVVLGFTGTIAIHLNIPGVSGALENASPGIALAFLGVIVLYIGRSHIKIHAQ